MIAVDPLYALEVRKKVLDLREVLVRFDENEKALKLMTECVPYIVASDHQVELMVDRTVQQNLHLKDPEAYRDYYANNKHEAPFEVMYGSPAENADQILPRVGWLRGRLGTLPLDVLDLACNDGMLAAVLVQDGHGVTGVDLNPDCIARAKAREIEDASFVVDDITEYKAHAGYDAVVAFEVIEHVPDPDALLRSMVANVKPGGKLYVSTPLGAVEQGYGRIDFDWDALEPKGHVRSYTPRQFHDLLHQYGAVELVIGNDRTLIAEVTP